MQGTWDDFTSKYGFNDGVSVTELDVKARNALIRMLREELSSTGMEITPFDRPGLHNYCLIDIKSGGESAQLPESVLNNIQELIDEAYELATYFPGMVE